MKKNISFNDVDRYLPEASHPDTVVELKRTGDGYKGSYHIRSGLDTLKSSVPEENRFFYKHEKNSIYGMQGAFDHNEFNQYKVMGAKKIEKESKPVELKNTDIAEAEAVVCLDIRNITGNELSGNRMVSNYCESAELNRLKSNKIDGTGDAGLHSAGNRRNEMLKNRANILQNRNDMSNDDPYGQMK